MRGHLPLLSLLTFLATPPLRAVLEHCERAFCRCIPASALGISAGELIRRQRDQAERVVFGRVVRLDTLAPHMVQHGPTQIANHPLAARVAVTRIWKGPPVDTLTVVIGSLEVASSCDLALEPGTSYLIFASRDMQGLLRTAQCSGTAAEDDAAATISTLGPGQEPIR